MQRELDQVDKEIELFVRMLAVTPRDNPIMRLLLRCIVIAHNKRFNLRHEPDDIQKVIKYSSVVLTLTPDDHSELPHLLGELGISHEKLFQRLGNKDDMEKAIEYKSLALALIPEGHPDLPRQLANLAVSHKDRFGALGELKDIENAIEFDSRAVEMTPEDDPNLPIWLDKLATSYSRRFGRFGELNDLESAIKHGSRALALTPDGHPDLSSHLANIAISYKNRFQRLGELSDLEQAIEYASRGLALVPHDHPRLSRHLSNLSFSYSHRFKYMGELSDLDRAIEYGSRALAVTPDNHPFLSTCLDHLAAPHNDRFLCLGELSDLDRAIEYQSHALALTPDGDPDLPICLTKLAVYNKNRFRHLGKLGDLEKGIEYGSRALTLTPNDHPSFSGILSNLSISHRNRFECLGEASDLEWAIEYGTRALALTPDNHTDLSSRLGNLAAPYAQRFQQSGELSDLEKAIEYGACALAAINHAHPLSCSWYFNHAIHYIYYYGHSQNPSHLQESLNLFRTAHKSSAGAPRAKFRHAHQWASQASKYSALNPIEAYQAAVDLLPQFIWLGATNAQRYEDLKLVETLAVDAAHAAIVFSNYSLALEWLEHTRCIVWNQNLMLRSPLDQLLASYPALATRLQTVANELHAASSNSRESQAFSRSITSEQAAQGHRRLAQEYGELLTQARLQPGFENFLQPMQFSGLICAARNGPIAVINCHEDDCDAILVLPSQSTASHLSLPNFSSKKARDAHSTMQSSLRRQGIRERGVRVHQETGYQDQFGSVLKILWNDVVKPILNFLGYTAHAPADGLPHITWCPTGVASFLPLHAAGDYDQPSSRVFDYVISSYTPTLTALLGSTPSTINCHSRVLAIGQATTPGHSSLPGTMAELKHVKSHIENRAGYSELIDAQATPAAVLDAMEEHDWVHLACHAHQNVYDPTKSGFFLHGGTLDLAAINRRSFNKKGLAFLSACQTATGDETLPDEAVHLASGMLMAGYSSVIATMWSVGDAEAPFVADQVYSQLMKKGTLGNGEAGRALHDAVEGLRARVGEKEFGRWVPFIHIGS